MIENTGNRFYDEQQAFMVTTAGILKVNAYEKTILQFPYCSCCFIAGFL